MGCSHAASQSLVDQTLICEKVQTKFHHSSCRSHHSITASSKWKIQAVPKLQLVAYTATRYIHLTPRVIDSQNFIGKVRNGQDLSPRTLSRFRQDVVPSRAACRFSGRSIPPCMVLVELETHPEARPSVLFGISGSANHLSVGRAASHLMVLPRSLRAYEPLPMASVQPGDVLRRQRSRSHPATTTL